MSKKIKKIVPFFLVLILIISSMYIMGYFYDVYSAKKQSSLIDDDSNNFETDFSNSLAKINDNKPASHTAVENFLISLQSEDNGSNEELNLNESPNVIEKNERMLKIEELQTQNPDIVGWLEIPGTVINYPVLQGTDNSFYVNHNYQKQKTASGSIFIDVDYTWLPKSTNMIIYGHNMKNGTMFTSLLNYKSKNYYYAHPEIRFTTDSYDVTYEIIAAFESKVYDKSDVNSFKYYNFIHAENKEEFDYFISNVKSISIYDTGKTAEYGDELMTLSTCAYHTKNGRFAVVARKLNTKNNELH